MNAMIASIMLLTGLMFSAETAEERPFAGAANQPVTLRAIAHVRRYSDGIGNYLISAFDSQKPNELLFGLRLNGSKLELVVAEERTADGWAYKSLLSKSDVPLGRAVYLCGVRTEDGLSLYIDGQNEGRSTVTTAPAPADRIRIGAECRTGRENRDLQGTIRHAEVFPRAFTDRQVTNDYGSLTGRSIALVSTHDGIYLPVHVPAKPAAFPDAPVRLKLDVGFIESFLPEGQYLDPVGIEVVKWDAVQKTALPDSVAFRSDYNLAPKRLVVTWKRSETGATDYAVCFNRPVKPDYDQVRAIPLITGGEPLSVGRTDLSAQGQGLAGYPVMLDYDGDGLRDLLTAFVIPAQTLFYKNIGTPQKPVFEAPQIAFGGKSLKTFDMFQLSDQSIYAYTYRNDKLEQWRAEQSPEGKTLQWQTAFSIEGLPADGNVFDLMMVDVNGDGVRDLLAGVLRGTWWWDGSDPWNKGQGNLNIGYGLGYDSKNKWYGAPPIGVVCLALNTGTDIQPVFSAARLLAVGDQPIEIPTTQMSVAMADMNGDGRPDLLVGCGVDETLIYHNVSTNPNKLELSMPVGAYRDSAVSQYSYFDQRFEVVDFDGDGQTDILMNSNPGITVLCRIGDGRLVEEQILEFRGANLWAETLVVPTIVDLNADGIWDVVTGDSSGFLSYFENTGTATEPLFASRKKLTSGGKIFRPVAGYSGSIQGPNEARWGYLAPNVCDFDGDGKPDVVLSDITGYNYWLKNVARRKGEYEFSDPQMLTVDTWPLKVRWRTRPAMWYAGADKAMPSAIITSDEEGFMAIYERDRIKGPAALKPGRRLTLTDGREVKLDGPSGYNGRSKFCTIDYNADENTDLLIGQPRRGMLIAGKRYDLSHEDSAYVALLINAAANDAPVFEPAVPLTLADGEKLYFGTHSCSPSAMDVDGDGREEIFIGTERGFVYSYNRSLFEDSSQIISVPEKKLK